MTAFLFGYVAVKVIGTMQPADEMKRVTQREPNPMQNYFVLAFFSCHFLHEFFEVFANTHLLQNCAAEVFYACAGYISQNSCSVRSTKRLLSM